MPINPVAPRTEWLAHVDERERIYIPAPVVRALGWPKGALFLATVVEGKLRVERAQLQTMAWVSRESRRQRKAGKQEPTQVAP